jgi:uncharacterized lipoprotein YmbA
MKNAQNFTIFLILLLVSGCSIFKPQKDPSIFYTLGNHSSENESFARKTGDKFLIINLLVEELPSYADCPYVVTKSERNKLVFSETHRWGEPLKDSCCRALQDRLSETISDFAMVISSTRSVGNIHVYDYRLSVDVDDIIYNATERSVILKCSWSLFDYVSRNRILFNKYIGIMPINGEATYENIVDAMKLALTAFADDVSMKIRQFNGEKSGK